MRHSDLYPTFDVNGLPCTLNRTKVLSFGLNENNNVVIMSSMLYSSGTYESFYVKHDKQFVRVSDILDNVWVDTPSNRRLLINAAKAENKL